MNASKHATVCQRIGPHTLTQKVSSIDIDMLAHLLSSLVQSDDGPMHHSRYT